MSHKHTPGPWHLEADEKLSAISCGKGEEYKSIAFLTLPNHQANARLIASAPELLEALKMALVWLDYEGKYDVLAIRAAIAKATGEA